MNSAAEQFSKAFDDGLTPAEFVADMRKRNQYIMGIGHRVKSLENPDARVAIVRRFVAENFPASPLLDYASQVELITTKKRGNLILNVDGAIAVAFVDLLRQSGQFSRLARPPSGGLETSGTVKLLWSNLYCREEADRYIHMGILNAIFVLGRTTGFIGHYIDQLRLDQGLYRHPWDDINYIMPS